MISHWSHEMQVHSACKTPSILESNNWPATLIPAIDEVLDEPEDES